MDTKEILKNIPNRAGVYLFKDHTQAVIYIGKAKALRTRLRSYFRKKDQDWKVEALMAEYATIDYILTSSELEALLLEAQMVRQHKPKYNVLLTTGNPFLYIVFTSRPFPEMQLVRNKKEKGTYFGPFIHKKEARAVFAYLMRHFKLRVCSTTIEGGCLDYHLGLCAGRCMGSFDVDGYKTRMQLAQEALRGNYKKAVKLITGQIKKYSVAQEYEKARNIHEILENLERIFETIKTRFTEKKYVTDIFVATKPKPVEVTPQHPGLQELQALLQLPTLPRIIDCFDISHLQSTYIVGSCIRFKDGKPEKSGFRRFKIKTLEQQNDYAALAEIVGRRYKNEEIDMPDVVLIDGGKGQLSSAKAVIPHLLYISLAKREETLFTPLHAQGIVLDLQTPLGQLIIRLRDYAHHFAISYHKLLRTKAMQESKK